MSDKSWEPGMFWKTWQTSLNFSHSLILDMLNNFCFHVYAQMSLFTGEKANAFFWQNFCFISTLPCTAWEMAEFSKERKEKDFARHGPLEPPTQASLTAHLVQDLQPLLTLYPTVQRSDIDWLPLTAATLTSRNPPFPFSDTLDWNLTL